MNLHKIVETIFVILLILFLIIMVIGIMTLITFIEEVNNLDVSFSMRMLFISGMAGVYLYLLRMIVNKFSDFHRYI
jgi:hypothetical protein